jgi:hypothetical protein
MIDFLRPDDVVVVWKLDRLSRSLKDLLHIMDQIHDKGGGFRSLTETIDTTTPAGRMLMQLLGTFADYAKPGFMRSPGSHRNEIPRRRSKNTRTVGALAPHNPASHDTTEEAA